MKRFITLFLPLIMILSLSFADQGVDCAIIQHTPYTVLRVTYEGADLQSATAVYQPGQTQLTPSVEAMDGGFLLSYGDTERYIFQWADDVLCLQQVRFDYESRYGNSIQKTELGLQFWQSGVSDSFTPIGDALWMTDGITLEEFNITQLPRSIGDVRRINAVKNAFGAENGSEPGEEPPAEMAIPLTAAVDTFMTDDPFEGQAAKGQIPAGTQVTGMTLAGEFYAFVEYQGEQLVRGYVPLKDLQPLYDQALSIGKDALYADVRWDVMDALIGKWNPESGSNWNRLILLDGGAWGSHVGEIMGNFRVYDGENGAYRMVMVSEDNVAREYILTLLPNGAITLSDGEDVSSFTRSEYSTYGNG